MSTNTAESAAPPAKTCVCGEAGRYTGIIKRIKDRGWGRMSCSNGHKWWSLPS